MTRTALSFLVSGLLLAGGGVTAWLQSHNFDRAARLDRAHVMTEWYERQIGQHRVRIERFEFESELDQTPTDGRLTSGVSRGSE